MPAYNRRNVIRKSVQSLLDQDFPDPYEVIVVDDGSTDDTVSAVAGMDPCVRVVRQPKRGAAVARYQGVMSARASVVAFQDSDDISYPNRLSLLWAALHRHSGVVASFALSKNRLGGVGHWSPPLNKKDAEEVFVIEDPLSLMIEYGTIIGVMNLMAYRSAVLHASQGLSFYRAANDYALQIRLAEHGSFACVPQALCEYEFLPTGISRGIGPMYQLAFSLCAADNARRSRTANPAVIDAISKRLNMDWARVIIPLALQREWRLLIRLCGIGFRHLGSMKMARLLWWQLDQWGEQALEDVPFIVKTFVLFGRFLRRYNTWLSKTKCGDNYCIEQKHPMKLPKRDAN